MSSGSTRASPTTSSAPSSGRRKHCDVLLVVGTAAEAYPAALLPAYAHHHGATVVEVNPRETRLTPRVDVSLRGRAADLLPALVRAAFG